MNAHPLTDLLLELQKAIEKRLGRWRAARDVHVNRNDTIASTHNRVCPVSQNPTEPARGRRSQPNMSSGSTRLRSHRIPSR